jgi:uncharacterized RDD family membrane protein YckC
MGSSRTVKVGSGFDLGDLDFTGTSPAQEGTSGPADVAFNHAAVVEIGRAADVEPVRAPSAAPAVAVADGPSVSARFRSSSAALAAELPLFVQGRPDESLPDQIASPNDDAPLMRLAAAPRAPLSVRRTTPDPARLRATYGKSDPAPRPTSLDLLETIDSPSTGSSAPAASMAAGALRAVSEGTGDRLLSMQQAGFGQHLLAAVMDAALLSALDIAIVWFTLDVCQLKAGQLLTLPWLPMLALFLLLDGGYLVLFTAACGQTVGKMVAGIRVVGTSAGAIITNEMSLGQAAGRALGSMVSFVPLGFGFWFALAGQGRTLHDRLAHTRVVRA